MKPSNPSPNPATRFKPGQSGNPKGYSAVKRAAVANLARAARDKATPEALAAWHYAVWKGNSAKAGFEPTPQQRLDAATWLANRGYGKEIAFKDQEQEDPLGLGDARDRLARRLAPLASVPDPAPES